MNEIMIPWDFFGLLALVFLVLAAVICCVVGLKARRRARLTNPRKDYIYGTHIRTNGVPKE